jgi:hypothetical protein
VLVGADAEALAGARRSQQGHRRAAIMVGDPDAPEVMAAAAAMAAELFGAAGTVEAVDGRSADASTTQGAARQ